MIPGRVPEITIKFNEKPEFPTEGKKVTVAIQGENNITVKAEMNRKTLKKQVSKMDEYENWVGAMSGKLKGISPEGIVELESVGLQVFEVKAKETEAKSERSSQAQEVSQTIDSGQSEKEAKIQKSIATATSPRDKAFYQELLQKTRAERAKAKVESSKASDSSDPNSAKKKEKTESSVEKNQTPEAIFQAVGVIKGLVVYRDEQLKIQIEDKEYGLLSAPSKDKRKTFEGLKEEIKAKGSSEKVLVVYPSVNYFKEGEEQRRAVLFRVVSVKEVKSEIVTWNELKEREFRLSGTWQYIGEQRAVTICRNWSESLEKYLEKASKQQKSKMLKPSYLPMEWSDAPVEAFRYAQDSEAENKKPCFVSVKAVFEPGLDKFKVIEQLAKPSHLIPRYISAQAKN